MNTQTKPVVRVTRRFDASPERVFDAWLDAASARKWLFATAQGQIVRAEIDARVGGRFILTDRRDGEHIEHTGEYLVIERPNRLLFTFAVPKFSAVYTQVSIGIAAIETGSALTLTHEDVLPEYVSRTESGWRTILDSLAHTL